MFGGKLKEELRPQGNYSNSNLTWKQEAHGPRLAHLGEIATADIQMQHFSNHVFATNERIIFWAVLCFEEEECVLLLLLLLLLLLYHIWTWQSM